MRKILISIGVLILLVFCVFLINKKWGIFELQNRLSQEQVINTKKTENYSLYGEWQWEYSTDAFGKNTAPQDPSQFLLSLKPEGKLESTTDCNFVSGSFIKNEEALSFGPLNSTEKACNGETLETVYVSNLSLVSSYTISKNILTLYLIKDLGVMTFSKK